jgi:hypothetical protein
VWEPFEFSNQHIRRLRYIFPKLLDEKMGCMHSKLQLLFHADRIRVVIPTVSPFRSSLIGKGNLMSTEWGEAPAMLENVSPIPQNAAQLISML